MPATVITGSVAGQTINSTDPLIVTSSGLIQGPIGISFDPGSERGSATINGTVIASAYGISSDGQDDIVIGQTGVVIGTGAAGADGMVLNGDDITLRVDGMLAGDDIGLYGNAYTDNLVLTVSPTGTVSGGSNSDGDDYSNFSAAIAILGQDGVINNAGAILGEVNPITGERMAIINVDLNPSIDDLNLDHDADLEINNSGYIHGDIYMGAGNDTVNGTGGTIQGNIYMGKGEDKYDATGGGVLNGILYLGDGYDVMLGGDASEVADGGNDSDYMLGGAGDDTLYGQHGEDTLDGEEGNDSLSGGDHSDTIIGGSGDDIVSGDDGDDDLSGGSGDDAIYGGADDDELSGGSGDDTLSGGTHDDELSGGSGDDYLSGDSGYDLVFGGTGNDTLDARSDFTSNDTLVGGLGDDAYWLWDEQEIIENENEGRDTVFVSASYTTYYLPENVEILIGNGINQVLIGNDLGNEISATTNSTLIGGLGADTLTGNAGLDVFVYEGVADSAAGKHNRDVITDFDQGADLIDLTAIDALASVAGNQAFTFIGQGTYSGAGGELRYAHMNGNTMIYGDVDGGGSDFVIELTGIINLQAYDFTVGSIGAIVGTAGADFLVGTTGAETMTGLSGSDTIMAGEGDDLIDAGTAGDDVIGGFGADTITGGAGSDLFTYLDPGDSPLGAANRDVITDFTQGSDHIRLDVMALSFLLSGEFSFIGTQGYSGAGGEVRYSHSGGNTIIYGDTNGGGSDFSIELTGIFDLTAADFSVGSIDRVPGTLGDEMLLGGDSDESITGFAGADTLEGGDGADTFVYLDITDSPTGGGNRDVITDFTQGEDLIDLSAIDALFGTAGDQAFNFQGNGSFTGAGGDIRYVHSGGNTLIYGDVDGGGSDFVIQLTGIINLTAGDFIL